ncbi:MAG TPA: hypothetical protein PLL69_04800 [Gemmatimonadales bacterium]|nr:hypothetical protein [Gemmatimonadales bacterium]
MRTSRMILAAMALTACDNAGSDLTGPEHPFGIAIVGVGFDRDGTGTPSSGDTIYAGARVALFVEGGIDTLRVATTDENGLAVFDSLPVGRYRYAVDPGSVGDSLPVISDGAGTIRIVATSDSIGATAAATVGYAKLTLAEARVAAAGRRVWVEGLVASGLQYHSDSATYLTGAAHLRVIPSEHIPGRSGNNPGDSVRVLGTTGSFSGQPVLLKGVVTTISERPAPVAEEVTVGEIVTARDGALDAALVHVGSVTIVDTITVGEDLHVTIATDSDTALAVLDSKLNAPTASFRPDRTLQMRGMLVPDPEAPGTWFIKPRPVAGEVVFD